MGAQNTNCTMKFIDIPEDRQREAINTVALQTGLPPSSIEKDWWVTQVLKALHTLPYAEHIAFKGGTSLSKCWNLIARFSEDVDIALSREFLGFSGELSKTQISDRLRRAACSFVREKMQHDVRKALVDLGIRTDAFSVNVIITPVTTTDPEVITITYHSLYEVSPYIKNTVKIEISGRSMMEPIEKKAINAAIDAHFGKAPFAEKSFEVNAVIPERTFLEKVFLLHEEFRKSEVRVERMSRHIYDLAMMMDSENKIADRAIHNEALYKAVLEHRRKFIGLKGFNYDELYPATLCIVPNEDIARLWQDDYKFMCEHMIFGQVPSFDELISKLSMLNEQLPKGMNINELGEDLEQQFGKPRNITEENVRFMLSLIKEEFDGTKVNENVEKPSLEAFGMTILAVMSYQTTPWEELAKKPSIRKTLKYIAIRGNCHYDEMEALTKELIRKHFDGITQKMVLGFLKIIRGVSNEERPTKLIEYTPFAAQYYPVRTSPAYQR